MKIGWLSLQGFTTEGSSIFVTGKNTHNAPERDVTTFQIPGRNGDFFVDNGRYKNIVVTYPCFVAGFSAHVQDIRNEFSLTNKKYKQLVDSYDNDHYRLARLTGGIEFEPVRGDFANFELSFDCDPRRFLFIGDNELSVPDTFENPTPFDSKPVIFISDFKAGAEIVVTDGNGKTYTMTATNDYSGGISIDSERQDIYEEIETESGIVIENKNGLFVLPDGFPILTEGENTVSASGTYEYIGIRPKWWEL